MSDDVAFVWELPLSCAQVEAALAAVDAVMEECAGRPGMPAVAIAVTLPEDDGRQAREGRARPLLTATLTGAALDERTVRLACARLFAALRAAVGDGGLPTAIPAPRRLAGRDWVRLSQVGLPAQLVGRFRILTEDGQETFWPGRLRLRLATSTAFGTGHHATTRGALAMLDALGRRLGRRTPAPMLDVGCGSGVLALAMTKLWKRPVWASDIDETVRPVVAAHARRNGAALRSRAIRGGGPALACLIAAGLDHPNLRRAGPFRLIVANILAGPLKTLASAFSRHLAQDGWLLLAGILVREARAVMGRYRRFGLVPVTAWRQEGWATIAFRRAPCARRPLPPAGRLKQRAAGSDDERPTSRAAPP